MVKNHHTSFPSLLFLATQPFQLSTTMRGVPVVLISAVYALPYQQLQQRGIRVLRKPLHIPTLLKVIEEQIAFGSQAPRG
jgi:hypothetical protein